MGPGRKDTAQGNSNPESDKMALDKAQRLRHQVIQVNSFSHLGSPRFEDKTQHSKVPQLNKVVSPSPKIVPYLLRMR
jgi:hypothetical protein